MGALQPYCVVGWGKCVKNQDRPYGHGERLITSRGKNSSGKSLVENITRRCQFNVTILFIVRRFLSVRSRPTYPDCYAWMLCLRHGSKTIGKSIRTYLSGQSITSYPTLTISTTDYHSRNQSVSAAWDNNDSSEITSWDWLAVLLLFAGSSKLWIPCKYLVYKTTGTGDLRLLVWVSNGVNSLGEKGWRLPHRLRTCLPLDVTKTSQKGHVVVVSRVSCPRAACHGYSKAKSRLSVTIHVVGKPNCQRSTKSPTLTTHV